jgi:hypothetical protein
MHIIYRTTSNKAGKYRPEWFSYEACFHSLTPRKGDKLIVFFDGEPDTVPEYIRGSTIVHVKDGGSETKSFRSLFEYLRDEPLDPDEIVYIVEDDYLHRDRVETLDKGSPLDVLEDVLTTTNVDYATLYDHADKYFPGYFEKFATGFKTFLFHTEKSHWRTTPSTTNTFAAKYKTLMSDMETHLKFSPPEEKTSRDHEKFHALWSDGRTLVSCVPGLSTHVENSLMSPCFDWSSLPKSSDLSVDPLDNSISETCV